MGCVRWGRNGPHLSVREIGAVCAQENGSGQLFRQLSEQPGPAQRPEAVGGAAADAQSFGRVLVRKAGEVAQLDEAGGVRVVAFQSAQRLVQGDEVVTA